MFGLQSFQAFINISDFPCVFAKNYYSGIGRPHLQEIYFFHILKAQ